MATDENVNEIKKFMLREIVDYGKYSFELEQEREKSILQQAAQMLTAFSIITATLFLFLPILLEIIVIEEAKRYIVFSSIIVTVLFVSSFILALLATWRYKYRALNNVKDFKEYVSDNFEQYLDEIGFLDQWIASLSEMQSSREKTNNIRAGLVVASMIVFFAGIFATLVLSIVGYLTFAV